MCPRLDPTVDTASVRLSRLWNRVTAVNESGRAYMRVMAPTMVGLTVVSLVLQEWIAALIAASGAAVAVPVWLRERRRA